MRRTLFILFGVLELTVAAALVYLGCALPGPADVAESFASAERVTDRAGAQVRLVRQQVGELRRPELQELARRLQEQTRGVTRTLRSQQIDYDTVRTLRDALADVAKGLDGLADTLDPASLGQIGRGLGETADFLDQKVVPAAELAGKQLDELTQSLRADARRLAELLRASPLDLRAAREVHDSLARFSDGLKGIDALLKPESLTRMQEGFGGLEESLTTGARQVERLAGYTYPVVTFDGLKPVIEKRLFWPDGDKIAEGMRKAADGAKAAGGELETLGEDLPRLRSSLTESRKVVDRTREALGAALKQQDKIEPLLRDVPTHLARLAEELPGLSANLSKILHDTRHLKEVATALRKAEKGLSEAVARWPDVRKMLSRSAVVLRTTRDQLDHTLEHRDEFEAGLKQTVVLTEAFATTLPLLTDHLDTQLQDQDRTLGQLGQSMDEFGQALPVFARSAVRLLQGLRWLIGLVALIVGLHGSYLVLSTCLLNGRRELVGGGPERGSNWAL